MNPPSSTQLYCWFIIPLRRPVIDLPIPAMALEAVITLLRKLNPPPLHRPQQNCTCQTLRPLVVHLTPAAGYDVSPIGNDGVAHVVCVRHGIR